MTNLDRNHINLELIENRTKFYSNFTNFTAQWKEVLKLSILNMK